MPEETFKFPFDQKPIRLDQFLATHLDELSRSHIKKLIEAGDVLVNGTPSKASAKLHADDAIIVQIPEAVEVVVEAEDIPLQVMYEDEDLIVIDKPAGMVVHPAAGNWSGTLVNALLHHCTDLGGINGELRPGIVHRIDKNTSGLLVAAKNDQAMNHLAAQFKAHSINRNYLALVYGRIGEAKGTIDMPIGRHPVHRKEMSTRSKQGKEAITHWRQLADFDVDRMSLLNVGLETGRTHQIRVHCAAIHHPLVGDPVYCKASKERAIPDLELRQVIMKLQRQALHAYRLGFEHPRTGEHISFLSKLPEDFASILRYFQQKYAIEPFTLPTGDSF